MGSIGRYMFRTILGAFRAVCTRPFSLASMDSQTWATGPNFPRRGSPQRMILGGVAADFLLFVLSKMIGNGNKAVAYPMTMARLRVVMGGLMDFNALRYREDG